jgi:hypothetical protein
MPPEANRFAKQCQMSRGFTPMMFPGAIALDGYAEN